MSNVENIVEVVETLEAPKVKKSRGRPKALVIDTALPEEPVVESPHKVKRQQSEKQKENFKKCLEARKASLELKRASKAQQAHSIPIVI